MDKFVIWWKAQNEKARKKYVFFGIFGLIIFFALLQSCVGPK